MLQLQESNSSSLSSSVSLSSSSSAWLLSLSSSLLSSSSSSSSDANLLPTPEKKVLQKNIIQNNVSKEHGKVYDVSNASNSTKSNDYKKDQDRKNELVAIIGDSMIKHRNDWDMSKKVHKSECRIYVKSFLGSKTYSMKYYVKPSLRSTPNHFILYVGTNDLESNQTS